MEWITHRPVDRLFDLVADDNAIVDTIYYLGKALNSERIDLVTFMKVYKKDGSIIAMS